MKFRILLQDQVEEELLKQIQFKHSSDIEGISDLYDELILNKTCESYEASKIYYVAYTLSLEDIKMIIVQVK